MIKIKNNVDLKELEKYGLILEYKCNNRTGEIWVENIYQLTAKDSWMYAICFYTENKKDYFLGNIQNKGSSILYDLIKDDLVEKVEE